MITASTSTGAGAAADGRLERAHRGLADALIHLARHAVGGATEEAEGVLVVAGEHPSPGAYCNAALSLGAPAETVIERSRAFFAPRRRGFVVWSRQGRDGELERLCSAAGWIERPPPGGMPILVLERPLERQRDGPTVDPIASETDARGYLEVVAAAYGLAEAPLEVQRAALFDPAAVTARGALGVLVRFQDEPAAGAMAVLRGGVACVLWIATAPEAQGRGLAGAALRALVDDLQRRGASLVCMQSSQQGLPRWTSMGFEQIGAYRRFLAPPPARSHNPPGSELADTRS